MVQQNFFYRHMEYVGVNISSILLSPLLIFSLHFSFRSNFIRCRATVFYFQLHFLKRNRRRDWRISFYRLWSFQLSSILENRLSILGRNRHSIWLTYRTRYVLSAIVPKVRISKVGGNLRVLVSKRIVVSEGIKSPQFVAPLHNSNNNKLSHDERGTLTK